MSSFTTTIGNWKIDKLYETEIGVTTQFLFPDWGDEPHPEPIALCIHTWVLRNGKRTILIDTAAGNGKHRPRLSSLDHLNTPYLARLVALGIAPEAVDLVLHTHLDVDHVGWNTQLRDGVWQPTFPNARHLCTAGELDYYAGPTGLEADDNTVLAYADSVVPVRDAGLIDTVEADGREIYPGISFLSATGHSVGHSVIRLADGEEVALFVGDLMHHPLQVARPELSSAFCRDRLRARQSRERILRLAVEQNALVLPAHFDGNSAGHVLSHGNAYAWAPA